jgi:small GTP-binding protein
MGALLSLFARLQNRRILLLGLDAAGKTTILYKLRLGEVITSIPTIGFNVEEIIYKTLRMVIWDVGGQDRIRKLWKHYYQGSDALIYVVDASDLERLTEARDELHAVLVDDLLIAIPVLIFCNKSDLPKSVTADRMTAILELDKLRTHRWRVQTSSAISGDGLYEGLDWLSQTLSVKP